MTPASDIDAIVELAEAETGVIRPGSKLRICAQPDKKRNRIWGEDEKEFLREHHGKLTETQMAEELYRTRTSVHICIYRTLHLCAPSKDPRILTAEHVAMGLGVDGKAIHMLMDNGRMPGRRLPGIHVTRIVDRILFLRWLVDPLNWIYFKVDRVGTMRPRGKRGMTAVYDFVFWEGARDLVLKSRAQWKDEWLTPGEVAHFLKIRCGSRLVNAAIHRGGLKATRWGNWRILKSDLPAPGMTINAYGKIVPTDHIGRNSCKKCGEVGHTRLTCEARRTNSWNLKTGRRIKN